MDTKTECTVWDQQIVEKVVCQNCGELLMHLTPHAPFQDIECTGCLFGAQAITNKSCGKDKRVSVTVGRVWKRCFTLES